MIRVRVPATSANIGPGFDALGMAFDLYNTYSFEKMPSGLEITGCPQEYCNENNLVFTSFKKALEYMNKDLDFGLRIHIESDIPVSRGLGSSAVCIVGGIKGASELMGGNLSPDEIIEIATEIEGHPDNIAPAVLGGVVISIMEDNRVFHNQIEVKGELKYMALIPDFPLSTEKARAVLPTSFSRQDAIYNLSRVSLLVSALANGRFDLIKYAIKDKLHQPYRGDLIPGYHEIMDKCEEFGSLGTYLSGAGPTIMTLHDGKNPEFKRKLEDFLATLEDKWTIVELNMDNEGIIAEQY